MFKEWLSHPLTRGLSVDSPRTTEIRKRIIKGKSFLNKLYREWYDLLLEDVPRIKGGILELGSGAGFIKEINETVITSEVFECEGTDYVLDACKRIPFEDNSLSAIIMTDVFHHLPDVDSFFVEATRLVCQGGVISMIEPWATPWGRFIYKNLHHEPFDPTVSEWAFDLSGPLSGANGALPWIVFCRDRKLFETKYPGWHIVDIKLLMPMAYLLSGGVSMRSLFPGWGYNTIRNIERMLSPFDKNIAMFAHITLRRQD